MKKLLIYTLKKICNDLVAILPTIKPDFFRKYPGTVPLILLFAIAGFLTSQFANSNNRRVSDCIEARKQDAINYNLEIDYLKELVSKKDSLYNDLQEQLLIKNGIIEKLPGKIDSIRISKKKAK